MRRSEWTRTSCFYIPPDHLDLIDCGYNHHMMIMIEDSNGIFLNLLFANFKMHKAISKSMISRTE